MGRLKQLASKGQRYMPGGSLARMPLLAPPSLVTHHHPTAPHTSWITSQSPHLCTKASRRPVPSGSVQPTEARLPLQTHLHHPGRRKSDPLGFHRESWGAQFQTLPACSHTNTSFTIPAHLAFSHIGNSAPIFSHPECFSLTSS